MADTVIIKKTDLEILKQAHINRKINTNIKNSHELGLMIEEGDVKNLIIHKDSISYEIDYKKRYNNLRNVCIILMCLISFLLGVLAFP